ncbi:MAG: nicotinate (nicotinamide) nucleotide adenylyltransferase [candidate division Zixibacteria bacterium]|jgi:nicotinate-nucleotide adenylyltransferase|nr:nicotinate (nicotinamide) nucleotide adenylyltransferase [candidate division Zixibacteria bacterium]
MSSPDLRGAWGIFGGRFDPIHNGHLALAADLRRLKNLDGIMLVPSYRPPHKPQLCEASYDDRVTMMGLATGGDPSFIVSDIERELDGPGYSLYVVRELKRRNPRVDFSFLIGADNIHDFRNWFRPEELAREVRIVAGARPGYTMDESAIGVDAEVELVSTAEVAVSGSEIRALVKAGAGPDRLKGLVPDAVAAFIFERRLYMS